MFVNHTRVHEDIVEEHCHARIQHVQKQVVHGMHERGRCIHKPHGHYDPFVKTVSHEGSSLQNVFISNMALPVSTVKINRCEVFRTSHLVQ